MLSIRNEIYYLSIYKWIRNTRLGQGKPRHPWGEQSRYSNSPRAHSVKSRMMTTPHPGSVCANQATKTLLFSNPLMSLFETQMCHERQICLKVYRILKVILENGFSAHCTQIWKLNLISMTIISKVARKCIWCCGRIRRCVTAPHWARRWGNIVQWGMKARSRQPCRRVLPMRQYNKTKSDGHASTKYFQYFPILKRQDYVCGISCSVKYLVQWKGI